MSGKNCFFAGRNQHCQHEDGVFDHTINAQQDTVNKLPNAVDFLSNLTRWTMACQSLVSTENNITATCDGGIFAMALS